MGSRMQRPLLIGPLPPPWGGARVSFQLFYDYLQEETAVSCQHYDIPIRNNRDGDPPGNVNHGKTLRVLCQCLRQLPSSNSVLIFGSRSFCFSYGLIILAVAKLLGKPSYVRFFGGRPMLEFANKPSFISAIPLRLLSLAKKITLETKIGANEFPAFLRGKTEAIPAYRPRGEATAVPPQDNIVRFVYVGGVTAVKGLEVLQAAFSQLTQTSPPDKPVEMHLYGAGPDELVRKLQNTPDVHFHGKVENALLRQRLPTYDAFVFPSRYANEGHPGVLIEAFMAGLPVIASNLPGIDEIIENEVNGLLIESDSVSTLTKAMRRLAVDPDFRRQLSTGSITSSNQFDVQNVAPQLAAAMGLTLT